MLPLGDNDEVAMDTGAYMKWRKRKVRAGDSVLPVDFHESGRWAEWAAAISFRIRSAGPAPRGRATRRFSASIKPGLAADGRRTPREREGPRTCVRVISLLGKFPN